MGYTTEYQDNVLTVRMAEVGEGWEQWFLLVSDIHWDNPHCRRDLLGRVLRQAQERGAGILIFGDLFCLMQGKYDPRASKADVRPEHQTANYLDAVVNTAAEYFEPYRENIMLVCPGNHESSVLKRQETDVIARFADAIDVQAGGYHVESGRAPKPLGGAWLHFYHDRIKRGRIGYDVMRAS